MGINDILNAGREAAAKAFKKEREMELTEIKSLVSQFAQAWWAEKDAKAKKDELRKKILELYEKNGVDFLDGDEGAIKVAQKKDSIGFIAKAAKEFLTEEQIEQCTGVTRKGGLVVEFVPATKRPGDV